jgi:hypothetical protein
MAEAMPYRVFTSRSDATVRSKADSFAALRNAKQENKQQQVQKLEAGPSLRSG